MGISNTPIRLLLLELKATGIRPMPVDAKPTKSPCQPVIEYIRKINTLRVK
jgi:hypothetical protein